MSNRLFPSWQEISKLHNKPQEGEIALLKFLDDNLPKDNNWNKEEGLENYKGWLIFFQPFLNGIRPDIVIFRPNVSMIIYEVKDWNLKSYRAYKKGRRKKFVVCNSRNEEEIKSPEDQVKCYKNTIMGLLIPSLGEAADKNKNLYGLIRTGVYFHNEKTHEARNFLSANSSVAVFGYDYLKKNKINNIARFAPCEKRKGWKKQYNKEVITWLKPPYHSKEQGEPIKLKGKQNILARPQTGHHRCKGVAGSGKTLALAYRAALLALKGYDVLILTFNITLIHYIHDMVNRIPVGFSWEKIEITHFHGLCKKLLNKFNELWPKTISNDGEERENQRLNEKENKKLFKTIIVEKVKKTINHKKYKKYDAILIDEGQDFYIEWYVFLKNYFLKKRDELVVVCDKKQNIYKRKLEWIDKRVNKKELEKFKDDFITLRTTFRLPELIVELSNKFSRKFKMNQDNNITKVERTGNLFLDQYFKWYNVEKGVRWIDAIYKAYLKLHDKGYHPSDIIILLPTHKYGIECKKYFERKKLKVNHVFREGNGYSRTNKKSFWMGDGRLKMSTVHSFKGWELLNVILFIAEKMHRGHRDLDSLIYTAITRARESLIIINANSRYKKFAKNLQTDLKK